MTHRECMADIPMFRELDPVLASALMDAIISVATEKTMETGALVFGKGDQSIDDGYILLEGEVRVLKEGNRTLVTGAPAMLGEVAQFHPAMRRTADVLAHTPLRVLHFSWRRLEDALTERLGDEKRQALTDVLVDYAWDHFGS